MSKVGNPLNLSLDCLYRPSRRSEKAPLLILLHGYGSNMHDLFSFAPYLNPDFAIVALQAPIPLGGPSHAWYSIYFDQPQGKWSDQQQARHAVNDLINIIEIIKKQLNVDENKISLLGFSQGAILSYAVAMTQKRIDKVVCLSGYLNPDILPDDIALHSCSYSKFFISHGTQDQVIPVDWARNTKNTLLQLGCDLTYKEYPIGHGVSPDNFEALNHFLNT